ncbi:2OG-Fe(II) oxygenase [Fluviispira multicolorata]|uniref:2OG-Fe(II) oxygenase n=1 Tax=Fluviispira multicolorata TaxID=2654512 RepID=A0A833N4Z1_9BACT|nr:2OG-Fe(II) oxygenase [Fluviispira multicolorata]KAB8029213.1 2OG-Fe(II) oxygenase [Fluviispira multicolorata]
MFSSQRIQKVKKLNSQNLESLITDNCLVLIIEDFYSKESSKILAEQILKSIHIEKYTHELIEETKLVQKYYGVDRIGNPFNSTYGLSPENETVNKYYEEINTSRERLRNYSYPAITPIDKLRLELDEQFIHGANVANFQGKKMLAGIARIAKENLSYLSAEQPHFDALPEKYCKLDEQFAANIYLKIPDSGGELEIWDVPACNPLAAIPDDWRAHLPNSIKISPTIGDLIIFNSRKPHAISSFRGEARISLQTFIGYKKNHALQIWN